MEVVNKREALQALGVKDKNMGCTPAQIVVLTCRIQTIAQHLSENKKDYSAQRALQCLLGKRRALLKYCARKNMDVYKTVLKTLGLRR